MASAFVPGVGVVGGVGSGASTFVAPACTRLAAAPRAVAATGAAGATARILDGLDTSTQQPYTFSRYILGPFQAKSLAPSGTSDEDRETVIRCTYRHVFGNAYIMEEERAELAVPESQFKLGAMTMREFVRAMGKSSAYRTRFFEGASMYRFVELNFMHFLGRAPDSHAEIAEHMNIYHKGGVDAEIDSYIDSEEYSTVFGDETAPFLRFRGAYTPCESFSKQCALKGGWANSDKAIGGAALSGYNGSDGRQMSKLITAHVLPGATTPYEAVAENTPLRTTSPNWYACPDPSLAPAPLFVSKEEIRIVEANVGALQKQYDEALARKAGSKDSLAPFRAMTKEMGALLERGPAFSGGDPLLMNPYARDMSNGSSPLIDGGCKTSDFTRFGSLMENDTLSRLEKELEEEKANLRVLKSAMAATTPLTPNVSLPSQSMPRVALVDPVLSRPKIRMTPGKKTSSAEAAAAAAKAREESSTKVSLGPLSVSVPKLSVPQVNLPLLKMPNMPNLPSLPNLPFGKK